MTSFGLTETRVGETLLSWRGLGLPLLFAAVLVLVSFQNFLLFHTLAELFPIFVAAIMYVVVWNTFRFTGNHFLMYLGTGYFWVAVLDLFHTILYPGMSIYEGASFDAATQLWVATRFLEALVLLTAPAFLTRRFDRELGMWGFAAAAALIYGLVFSGWFPRAFVEGVGLTPFKVIAEYVIVAVLVGAMLRLRAHRAMLENRLYHLMVLCILLTVIAELAFTFYVSAYGISNLIGHIFKLFSFWLIFLAIIRTTLAEPFTQLARDANSYDAVPDATVVVERDGVIRQANRSAARQLRVEEHELVGRHCHDLFHSRALTPADCPICAAIGYGEPLESVETEFTESGRWWRFALSPLEMGGRAAGMVHVCREITGRKRAEVALRENEERYRALFDFAPDSIAIIELEGGGLVQFNERAHRGLGYERDEFARLTVDDITIGNGLEELKSHLSNIRVHGSDQFETLGLTKLGEPRDILVSGRLVTFDGQEFLQSIWTDITGRKQAEREIRHYADIVGASRDLMAYLSEEFIFQAVNEVYLEAHGRTRDEVVGKPVSALFHGEVYTRIHAHLRRCIAGERVNFQARFDLAGWGERWLDVSYHPSFDAEGRVLGVVVVSRDVTERHQMEMALERSAMEWAAAIDSIEDAVYLLDTERRLLRANKRFYQIIDSNPAMAVGRHIVELVHPGGEQVPCPVCEAQQAMRDELIVMEPDHPHNPAGVPLEVQVHIVRGVDGEASGIVMTMRDLSEHRRGEQALRDAKESAEGANRAKSEFLAVMSHEIRTPMNAILGMGEMLADTRLTSDQREYLKVQQRAGKGLLNLINDILDISKLESGALELREDAFTMAALVDSVVAVFSGRAETKGLAVRYDVDPFAEGGWRGDEGRLRQVLVNLVGNAIKFTPEGEVRVSVERRRVDGAREELAFAVSDTGIGIAPEDVKRVFAPFTQVDSSYTRRYGGTGLGLSIVQRLVGLLGGELACDSEVGRGSTFRFTLELDRLELPGERTRGALEGRRVLVLSREEASKVARRLAAMGAEVERIAPDDERFSGGRAACERDLLVVDHHDDEALFPLLEALRDSADVRCPVLVVTPWKRDGDLRRARDLGVEVVNRPLSGERLAEAAAVLLTGAPSEAPKPAPPAAPAGGLRILLAEDSPDNALLIRSYLKGSRHRLTMVENGEEAVAAVQAGGVDLVLMDIQMPVLDGYGATRAIREWESAEGRERLTIVALTAHALKEDEQRSLDAGCDLHLTKPVKKSVLLGALDSFAAG